jgi:hypothetical protein
MNEVNMKYWFSDFLAELGLFIEKPIFTKKKFPSLCRLARFHGCPNENFVRTIFERCFSIWITEVIGLTGVSFHFWPQKQIPSGSHSNFWLFFHFHVKNLPIYVELKKVYFMGSEMQPGVMRAQKRNLIVMKVMWPIHRSEMLSSKKYKLWGLKWNHKSWEPKNLNKFNFWN